MVFARVPFLIDIYAQLFRAPDVVRGKCFIYRVDIDGERATLQVGLNSAGPKIDELQGYGNDTPSNHLVNVVERWIQKHRYYR